MNSRKVLSRLKHYNMQRGSPDPQVAGLDVSLQIVGLGGLIVALLTREPHLIVLLTTVGN